MGGVCWAVVDWQGWVVQVGPASVTWQSFDIFAPIGAVAGIEGGHAICRAEAVDGIVVVGPEVLLVGCLSNDVGW